MSIHIPIEFESRKKKWMKTRASRKIDWILKKKKEKLKLLNEDKDDELNWWRKEKKISEKVITRPFLHFFMLVY